MRTLLPKPRPQLTVAGRVRAHASRNTMRGAAYPMPHHSHARAVILWTMAWRSLRGIAPEIERTNEKAGAFPVPAFWGRTGDHPRVWRNMSRVISALLCFYPMIALGDGYSCAVRNIYVLDSSGSMKPEEKYASLLSARSFTVDRQRGVITGPPLDNTQTTEVRVLNLGSSSSAFKVLSLRASDDPIYFRIDVYRGGTEFPFVGYKGSEVFTGVCRAL